MDIESKFISIYIYNYLRNIVNLAYHETLSEENLAWGFNSVDAQTCVLNQYDLDDANRLFGDVSNRQTKSIRLITGVPNCQERSFIDFKLIHSKSILSYEKKLEKGKTEDSHFFSINIVDGAGLKTILEGKNYDGLLSRHNLQNLATLSRDSLITMIAVYQPNSLTPICFIVLFPLNGIYIFEVFSSSDDQSTKHDILNWIKTFLATKPDNSEALIIVDSIWNNLSLNTLECIGRIDCYEKRKISNKLRPVAVYPDNDVLKSKQQFLESWENINLLGLPTHNDLPKNWDSLAALSKIINSIVIEKKDSILDAGGEFYSVILYHLAAYGYKNLHCLNLEFRNTKKIKNITYHQGDITKSPFDDGTFAAITCLSVIEHIPDMDGFFKEASRILQLEGLLFISADYWKNKIDTRGKQSYGQPFKIYDEAGIKDMITIAEKYYLNLTEPANLSCKNKVVTCEKLKYTFIYLTFKKLR